MKILHLLSIIAYGMQLKMTNKTAILLSGGMDSIALAYWKRPDIAITIDYGQVSAEGEIRAANKVCKEIGLKHEILKVDCRGIGSGELAKTSPLAVAPNNEWWPFRNQLLVTFAATRVVGMGVGRLMLGTVSTDSEYADGRKSFYAAIDKLLSVQEGAMRVVAPAIDMTSMELIKESGIGLELLSWAHSCTRSSFACGRCRSCVKHREVMRCLGWPVY